MIVTEIQMYFLQQELKKNKEKLNEIKESNSKEYLTAENNSVIVRNEEINNLLNYTSVPLHYDEEQISIGTTFSVGYLDDEYEEEVYTLIEQQVSKEDCSLSGFITVTSPLGNAVHRKKAAETFAYKTKNSTIIGNITKIYTKEEQKEYFEGLKTKNLKKIK